MYYSTTSLTRARSKNDSLRCLTNQPIVQWVSVFICICMCMCMCMCIYIYIYGQSTKKADLLRPLTRHSENKIKKILLSSLRLLVLLLGGLAAAALDISLSSTTMVPHHSLHHYQTTKRCSSHESSRRTSRRRRGWGSWRRRDSRARCRPTGCRDYETSGRRRAGSRRRRRSAAASWRRCTTPRISGTCQSGS